MARPGPNVLLACAAGLAVCVLLGLSHIAAPPAAQHCAAAWQSWLHRRHTAAHVQQMLAEAQARASAPSLAPQTAASLGGLAADAMRHVGWRPGVRFAAFDGGASLARVLADSWAHAGAFLLIVPGSGPPERRADGTPFLSLDPASANLTAALAPAAAALNTAVTAAEAALGRHLFAFRLEEAPLPACAAGAGPCAVWEASSGRVVLHSGVVSAMAAASGPRAGSPAAAGLMPGGAVAEQEEGGGGLAALLAAFAGKLAEQATALLQGGQTSLPALASVFAQAGSAAVSLLMIAAAPPLWWCIACPIVLGMAAPFVFNLGLTAAAEALCSQLQLPADTCADLWWGAFALALVLSLGAAIPIVYICRLPECGRRTVAAAAGGAAAVARLLSA